MSKLSKAAGGRMVSGEVAQRSPTQTAEERRFQAESDLRTCQDYHKLSSDSARMKAVAGLAKEQMVHLAKVANHASGATTRSGGGGSPKAASRSGDRGGGGSGKSGKVK